VCDRKIEALAGFLDQRASALRTRIEIAAAFARNLPGRIELIVTPEFEAGVGDLAGLKRVANVLARSGGRQLLASALKALKAERHRLPGDTPIAPEDRISPDTP
jgi:hypothetical protein